MESLQQVLIILAVENAPLASLANVANGAAVVSCSVRNGELVVASSIKFLRRSHESSELP